MYKLNEIQNFLLEIGVQHQVTGLQPLIQWEQPTAFRVHFASKEMPTAIVKHIPISEDSTVACRWNPKWKVAQDFVNLSFLNECATGEFAPKIIGYSENRNMVALQDLGPMDLRTLSQIGPIARSTQLWKMVCEQLAVMTTMCPSDPRDFRNFAETRLPGFAVLEKYEVMDETDYRSVIGMARHIDFNEISALRSEIVRIANVMCDHNKWVGYSVGDLWHQHVLFHEGHPKFIDFHCGGYDIILTDLMRLLEGTPIYQDEPLPLDLVESGKESFFMALASKSNHKIERPEFDEVYGFCLLRHIVAMIGREVIQYARFDLFPRILRAVQYVQQQFDNRPQTPVVIIKFLETLETMPNKTVHRSR